MVEGIENAAAVLLETTKVLRPFKFLIFPIFISKQPKPSYCNSIIFRVIEPGEPGEQGGRRRLPAVDQGAASQFIIS